jgi:hypothetical protein
MSGPFRLGSDELGQVDAADVEAVREALAALELAADEAAVVTGAAFTDRIMAALADEPSPAPTGFLLPIRRRGLLAGFAASVREAWASVGAGRPAFGRAAALAYVLVVAVAGTSVVGAATFGAAGALGLLGPQRSAEPSPEPSIAPLITPEPTLVPPTPTSTPSIEPSETPEGPESSDDHGGGSGPEPSDDHGGNSGPGGGSDDGSSGSGGGSSGGSDDGTSGGSGPSGTDDHGGSSGDDTSGHGG